MMYKHFFSYAIVDKDKKVTGEGNCQIVCNFTIGDLSDIELVQTQIPNLPPDHSALVRNFQLIAVKIDEVWKPLQQWGLEQ